MAPVGLGPFPQDVTLALRFDRTVAPPTADRRGAPPPPELAVPKSRHLGPTSSCCDSGVEPTRSQKSTVSWRRSPAGVGSSSTARGSARGAAAGPPRGAP